MARNDHSGYPMKWFKDENAARRSFECVICLEVVKDAVQVRDCGHQFCALCIDDILRADPRCPTCRIEISDAMVFDDQAARRMINQLEVNCCNEGCTWQGCLSSLLQGHQNNCKFLIQHEDNDAHKLKVEELEQKHDTLMLRVILFEEKHEQDITTLKLKHEQDIKELELKHEEDIKELKLKHEQEKKEFRELQLKHQQEKQDIRELQLKLEHEKQQIRELHLEHEQEKQNIRELQLKHEKEFKQDIRELQLKHEKEKQDIRELQLKLEQTDHRWQQQKEEDKPVAKQESKEKQPQQQLPKTTELPFVIKNYKDTEASAILHFLPSSAHNSQLKRSKNRWQRPEEREQELTKEEKKTAELYRNVVAILNKLTPQKFKSLVEQFMALNIDTPERLEGVINRIYEKAIREPMYSVAYANMCRCLFTIKVADAEGNDVSFRKLLLNRCQKGFEEALPNHLLGALAKSKERVETKENIEALAKNKKRKLGNIRFIGELYKLKLLTRRIMQECVYELLRAGDEENLEIMCELLFNVGKDLDSNKFTEFQIDEYFREINEIIASRKVSLKVLFMLRDVVDLRENQWIPRREENYNPKTIDQIHKEAQLGKRRKEKQEVLLSSKDNKKKHNVLVQGQRQGYIPGHPMSMAPRRMRDRPMYSSSPQGNARMQGFIPQQNMQYQVVGQIQQQQQQQQQQPPPQATTPPIQTNNASKPKPKRTCKFVIRDPRHNNKDVIDEILSNSSTAAANGRAGGTPPLTTTSTAQTESSTIQAQFAAHVAACVGEKGAQGEEVNKQ